MKLIIEPGLAAKHYWHDLWRYRELMYFLAWRDLAVRYKQTAIGVTWALIRPAITMLVFVAFRRLVDVSPGEAPEALLVFAAVLPWQFFSTALSESSSRPLINSSFISKVSLPALLIPTSPVGTALRDLPVANQRDDRCDYLEKSLVILPRPAEQLHVVPGHELKPVDVII